MKPRLGRRGALAAIGSGVALLGAAGLAFVYFSLMGGSAPSRLTLSAATSGSAGEA